MQHDAWSAGSRAGHFQTEAGSDFTPDQPDAIWVKLTGAKFLNGLLAYSWTLVEPADDDYRAQNNVLWREKLAADGWMKGTVVGVNGETETKLPAYESSTHGPLPFTNAEGKFNTVVQAFRGYGDYYLFSMSPDVEMILNNSTAPDSNGCYDGTLQLYDPVARQWITVLTGVCLVDGSGGTSIVVTAVLMAGDGQSVTVTEGLVTAISAASVGARHVSIGPDADSGSGSASFRALVQKDLPRLFYHGTAVTGPYQTSSETSLLSGSPTFPANAFNLVGRGFRVRAWGLWNTDATTPGTLQFKLKLGSAIIGDSFALTAPAGITLGDWFIEADVVFTAVGASGSCRASGWFKWIAGAGGDSQFARVLSVHSDVTVDTTVSKQLDLTATFGTADTDNYLLCYNCSVELLN